MKEISIFKNKDKKEGQPDYRLVASWKDGEEWKSVTVGSLWKSDGTNPNAPTLKGTMSKEYTNAEGKVFPAFEIKRAEVKTPPESTLEERSDELEPEDIPFNSEQPTS